MATVLKVQKFGAHGVSKRQVVVRAELLKKPELKRPDAPKLFSDAPQTATSQESTTLPSTITIEYQRMRAKEMTNYFRELKVAETGTQSQIFGWTKDNEINNGRWTMFGLAIGMLTEYATGVDFIDQLKLMVSYMGILDLE